MVRSGLARSDLVRPGLVGFGLVRYSHESGLRGGCEYDRRRSCLLVLLRLASPPPSAVRTAFLVRLPRRAAPEVSSPLVCPLLLGMRVHEVPSLRHPVLLAIYVLSVPAPWRHQSGCKADGVPVGALSSLAVTQQAEVQWEALWAR